jgi:hypothetical protein
MVRKSHHSRNPSSAAIVGPTDQVIEALQQSSRCVSILADAVDVALAIRGKLLVRQQLQYTSLSNVLLLTNYLIDVAAREEIETEGTRVIRLLDQDPGDFG